MSRANVFTDQEMEIEKQREKTKKEKRKEDGIKQSVAIEIGNDQ